MGGSYLGMVVEAMVAILLIVTIGYCLIVNRKLENLRSDKSELREIILNLHRATTQAEQAIGSLRQTATTVEGSLAEEIARAQTLESRLADETGRADALLSKLSMLISTRPKVAASPEAPRPAVPAQPAAAQKPPSRFRHSEMGLGLLNAAQRSSGNAKPGMKDVA